MDIKKFVRPNIYSLSAYEAKEIPCKVKLNANESPYGLSSETLRKLVSPENRKLFASLNRYPDPEAKALKKLISVELGLAPKNILQGNGSDELIYYLITTFGGPVLYPVPTFSMYGIIAKAIGERNIEVPLDEDFDIEMGRTLLEIRREKPGIIFLSSPNNPTGNCFSAEKILKIIEMTSSKSIVVVDEAYQPFASDKGFVPMLKDYGNLVIMRTLSKIGLAGLRVGFMIANEDIIGQVNKIRLPFNLNSLSQRIALDVMKNRKMVKLNIKSIVSERERLFNELSKIQGIRPYPSEANFILFRLENSDRVFKGLLSGGVLVRNMKGVVDNCLRVTVGTPAENKIFINVLKKALRS